MDETEGHRGKKTKKSWLKPLLGFLALGIIGVFIGMWLAGMAAGRPDIPAEIVKQATFPVYVPGKLPSNYQIDQDAFSFDNTTLIFQAVNNAGSNIAFSEQPIPPEFDFDAFYKEQMEEAKNIDGTPFPSVWGKAKNGTTILSVVTDKTWIIASSNSPLTEGDMKRIASGIRLDD